MLQELQIPYDEIHFGQPYAHVYVDASVACSALDTEKDLGWRVAGARAQLEPGMVAARHFNNVQIEGEYVIKTAARSLLRGEIFFYEHLPKDIEHLFPSLVSSFSGEPQRPSPALSPKARDSKDDPFSPVSGKEVAAKLTATPSEEDTHDAAGAAAAAASAAGSAPGADAMGVASLTLQRIRGVTFTHLVTNRSLTPGRLVLMMKALRQLHSSSGDAATLQCVSAAPSTRQCMPLGHPCPIPPTPTLLPSLNCSPRGVTADRVSRASAGRTHRSPSAPTTCQRSASAGSRIVTSTSPSTPMPRPCSSASRRS